MKLGTHQNYRDILRAELAERCARNARYSQRSFAKDLNLYPGRLNEILNGKKGLSRTAAFQIAKQLRLSGDESNYFCDLVLSTDARSPNDRKIAALRLSKYKDVSSFQTLQLETFKLISDWYHLAILELMELRHFKSDPNWISKTLGISVAEVNEGLKRLERLKFIKKEGRDYVTLGTQTRTPDEIPSDSIRSFHEQVLGRAVQSLYRQGPDTSEFNSTFLALSKTRIPEAKEMIKAFWKEFSKKLQVDDDKDALYCLSVQFFNLLENT